MQCSTSVTYFMSSNLIVATVVCLVGFVSMSEPILAPHTSYGTAADSTLLILSQSHPQRCAP